jgi:steroid delta-isomerase-like uncharacterized protein
MKRFFKKLSGKNSRKDRQSINSPVRGGPPTTIQQLAEQDELTRATYLRDQLLLNDNTPEHHNETTPPRPNGKGPRVTTTTVRVPPPAELAPAAAALPQAAVSSDHHDNNNNNTSLSSSNELTRNLVKRFIADIWNRGDIDLIPQVCSSQLRFNGNTGFDRIGHDGLARMVATIREALDDYHCEIHSMVVEHNKAFCRLRFTGKHTGPLLGYAPTRKVVAWMGATEFTCQNGKILKVWELGDVKSLEEQLMPDTDGSSGNGNKQGADDVEI